jgi:hypothetical protein
MSSINTLKDECICWFFIHFMPLSFCNSSCTACVVQQCKRCDKPVVVFFFPQVDSSQCMNERFADNSALQLSHKVYNISAESEPLLPWLDMNHDQLYHMLMAQVRVECRSLILMLSVSFWFIY